MKRTLKISFVVFAALAGALCQAADVVIVGGPYVTLNNAYAPVTGPARVVAVGTSFTYTIPSIDEADVTHFGSLTVSTRTADTYNKLLQFASDSSVSWNLSLGIGPQPDGSTTSRDVRIYQFSKRLSRTAVTLLGSPSSADASVLQNIATWATPLNLTSYRGTNGTDSQSDAVESSGFASVPVTFTCWGGVWYGSVQDIDATWTTKIGVNVIGSGNGTDLAEGKATRVTRYKLVPNP